MKDEDAAHPVADAWRPVLAAVVQRFARGDYGLRDRVPGVNPVPDDIREHIRAYVADYGATLVELPEETWATSRAQWMGTHWHVLVDLWTEEEGRSDLVLDLRVEEAAAGFRFIVDLVYVP